MLVAFGYTALLAAHFALVLQNLSIVVLVGYLSIYCIIITLHKLPRTIKGSNVSNAYERRHRGD